MRISDWSSDVCSSDLVRNDRGGFMAAVTYQKTSAVNMATRAPCSLAETTPGTLGCVNSASTIGGRAVLPNGQQINFNQVLGGNGNFFEPYSAAQHKIGRATSELQSLMRLSYAVFCLKKKK